MSAVADICDVHHIRVISILLQGNLHNRMHRDTILVSILVEVVVVSIVDHHYVQDDTAERKFNQVVLVPKTGRTVQTVKTRVNNSKCTFYVLTICVLCLLEWDLF